MNCPHCNTSQAGVKFEHGRMHCPNCKGWFTAYRPDPGIAIVQAKPKPALLRSMRLEQPTYEIPAGMAGMGFKLIEYDDGTMFAVSSEWGCTDRLTELEQVVEQARKLVKFVRFVKRKQQQEQSHENSRSKE